MNRRRLMQKRGRRGSSMAEAAITLPVIMLMTFAMVNVSMAWYAAVAASNAANYGARIGSVAQTDPQGLAVSAAQTRLDAVSIGSYSISASGGGSRGSQITVSITWTVPNHIVGLMTLLGGGGNQPNFTGTVISTFRQEGW